MHAPVPYGQDRRPSRHARYLVEFEPVDSDGEYISTCLGVADLLGLVADAVDDWIHELVARGVPAEVITHLQVMVDQLDDAAAAARRSASNFADVFEEARALAARGIKILGTPRNRAA